MVGSSLCCTNAHAHSHPCPRRVWVREFHFLAASATTTHQPPQFRIMGCVIGITTRAKEGTTNEGDDSRDEFLLTVDDGTGCLEVCVPKPMLDQLLVNYSNDGRDNNNRTVHMHTPVTMDECHKHGGNCLDGQTLDCVGTRTTILIQEDCDEEPSEPNQKENEALPTLRDTSSTQATNGRDGTPISTMRRRRIPAMIAETLIVVRNANLETLRWFELCSSAESPQPGTPTNMENRQDVDQTTIRTSSLSLSTSICVDDVFRCICASSAASSSSYSSTRIGDDDGSDGGPTLDDLSLVFGLDPTCLGSMLQELQVNGEIYKTKTGSYLPI